MTPEQKELLAGIRRRFVGTGEEHELLAKLATNYQDAYDDGAKYTEQALQSSIQYDLDAVKFARALCSLNYQARNFIESQEIYDLAETARWLKSINKTPAVLRQIADEMENLEQPAA